MTDPGVSIDHVHLLRRDPHEVARWLADHLGGPIEEEAEIRGGVQIPVRFGDGRVMVRGRRTGEDPDSRGGARLRDRPFFGLHIMGDFEAYCEGLRRDGVRFTLEPRQVGSIEAAFIEAPEGLSIELLQRGE